MKKIFYLALGLIFIMSFNACHYIDIVPDDGSQVEVSDDLSFSTEIEPIFATQSCTNCHPGMSQPDLTTGNAYQSLTDGDFINTKKPEESSIYTKPLPDGSHAAKYTSEQAQLILAWIEQGAKDN